MEKTEKMLFNLQRFTILQTKINPQTKSSISDDYAYAWYSGVYPFFDENELTELYKDFFEVKKGIVRKVIEYLDAEWLNRNYYTFYQIRDYFNKDEIDKYQLILILKYVYLHGGFDQEFWNVLLKSGEYPIEAKSIISKFDILGIRLY
jgi:hypothetical protein